MNEDLKLIIYLNRAFQKMDYILFARDLNGNVRPEIRMKHIEILLIGR